jgi:hypothetical protein
MGFELALGLLISTAEAHASSTPPYAYIKDVMTRLPTQKASQIEELLPHRWQPRIIAA